MGGKAAGCICKPPENDDFGNSSIAKSVPKIVKNDENENSCVAKNLSSEVIEENVSCALNPKFCVTKIRGLINGKSALLLVNTGSAITLVNESFVDHENILKVSNINITSASGDKIEIIGKTKVKFNIGYKCEFEYNVYVASNFHYQCILGLDILVDYSCNVDLSNDCLHFQNESVMFENENVACMK